MSDPTLISLMPPPCAKSGGAICMPPWTGGGGGGAAKTAPPPPLRTSRTTLTSFSSVSIEMTDSCSPRRRPVAAGTLRTSVPSMRTIMSPIFREECHVELSGSMSTITICPLGDVSSVMPGEYDACKITTK